MRAVTSNMKTPKYKRVIIKLSGEALATANGSGIDYAKLSAVCDQIIEVKNLGVEAGSVSEAATSGAADRRTAK